MNTQSKYLAASLFSNLILVAVVVYLASSGETVKIPDHTKERIEELETRNKAIKEANDSLAISLDSIRVKARQIEENAAKHDTIYITRYARAYETDSNDRADSVHSILNRYIRSRQLLDTTGAIRSPGNGG